MTAKFNEQITIQVGGRFVYYFEMDTENFKVNIKSYAVTPEGERLENTLKQTGWFEMFVDDEKTIPNLPIEDHVIFAQAIPAVRKLVYAFAKQGGIVPKDATVE